jgi:diacylglycerol kinase family enzyme
MEQIGTGRGIAALLNGRAKRVNAKVVRALERALPEALILVSQDFEQARRHVRHIVEEKPLAVLSGGGDGAVVRLLNLLREEGRGAALPKIGVLKLGTGNGWARTSGATDFFAMLKDLPKLPRDLPAQRFDLVEVEGQLCHFAGVGWDAKLLNDYLRNLDKRSSQLVGSRLASSIHKGIPGYLYSVFRITVPEEWSALRKLGQAQVVLENRGPKAFGLSAAGELEPLHDTLIGPRTGLQAELPRQILFEGPVSVGAASSTPEWGFNFRAFPFARAKPGFINVRVYDRPVLQAVRSMFQLWKGERRVAGMHDFFATHVAMRFSRPMPFQIGGDGVGLREQVEFRTAKETVPLIDWRAAMDAMRAPG